MSRNQREGRYVGKWRGVFRRAKRGASFGAWPGPRSNEPHGCETTRKDRKADKMDMRHYYAGDF